MAHNVETMAYAGETPWHGLGTRVSEDISSEEMLIQAGLNWEVRKIPLSAKVGEGIVMSNHEFLVRSSDNNILDEVTTDWKPVQNSEAFEFFKGFVDAGQMKMHTAGSLRDGQIVWALAKVDESFEVFGHDRVDSYMLFVNPHKFGQSIDVRFTPIRVVCNNTLSLALQTKGNGRVRLTHRSEFDAERVKEMLGIAHNKMGVYKEAAELIGSKRFNKSSINDYMSAVFPVISKAEVQQKELSTPAQKTIELLETQPGAEFAPGTFWSAFNAVTYYVDHVAGRGQDTRLTSAWFGNGKKIKDEALSLAIKFAEAA